MKRFKRGSLGRRAVIVCLVCGSSACLLGRGNPMEISVPLDCTNDTWTATTTVNAPEPRETSTAIWTGREMIIWGGFNFDFGVFNTGAR